MHLNSLKIQPEEPLDSPRLVRGSARRCVVNHNLLERTRSDRAVVNNELNTSPFLLILHCKDLRPHLRRGCESRGNGGFDLSHIGLVTSHRLANPRPTFETIWFPLIVVGTPQKHWGSPLIIQRSDLEPAKLPAVVGELLDATAHAVHSNCGQNCAFRAHVGA